MLWRPLTAVAVTSAVAAVSVWLLRDLLLSHIILKMAQPQLVNTDVICAAISQLKVLVIDVQLIYKRPVLGEVIVHVMIVYVNIAQSKLVQQVLETVQ